MSSFLPPQVPAETGTLIFLCGGDAEVYASQAAALDAMGKVRPVLIDFVWLVVGFFSEPQCIGCVVFHLSLFFGTWRCTIYEAQIIPTLAASAPHSFLHYVIYYNIFAGEVSAGRCGPGTYNRHFAVTNDAYLPRMV